MKCKYEKSNYEKSKYEKCKYEKSKYENSDYESKYDLRSNERTILEILYSCSWHV